MSTGTDAQTTVDLARTETQAVVIRLALKHKDQEVARVLLYIMHNELHKEPFGIGEDLFVTERARGRGYADALTREIIAEARRQGCYKLIITSRHGRERWHNYFKKMGFADHGRSFRIDFQRGTSSRRDDGGPSAEPRQRITMHSPRPRRA